MLERQRLTLQNKLEILKEERDKLQELIINHSMKEKCYLKQINMSNQNEKESKIVENVKGKIFLVSTANQDKKKDKWLETLNEAPLSSRLT